MKSKNSFDLLIENEDVKKELVKIKNSFPEIYDWIYTLYEYHSDTEIKVVSDLIFLINQELENIPGLKQN
jgi:hypothetical protein